MSDYFADNAAFIQAFGDALNLDSAIRTSHDGQPDGLTSEVWEYSQSGQCKHLMKTTLALVETNDTQWQQIEKAVNLIRQCRDNGGTVYTCGNGGSAATASHFTNDLLKAAGCRSICLTDSIPLLTAYSNDISYSMALHEIANQLFRKGDMVVAISVSGTSRNVVMAAAVKTARPYPVPVIGLGSIRETDNEQNLAFYSDVFIAAQHTDMMIAESVHLAVCHAIVAGLTE